MLFDLIFLNLSLLRARVVFEVEQILVCNAPMQGTPAAQAAIPTYHHMQLSLLEKGN